MESREGEVLELPLDRVDTEAVRERRVDLKRLARFLELLLLPEVLDRPHVVQTIRKLDHDDAAILRHRDDHLSVVLSLRLFPALEPDARQLRDALGERGDLLAELRADVLDGGVRVLDDVVKKRGRNRGVVLLELGEDPSNSERMVDEVFPAPALLAFVRLARERERPLDQLPVGIRVVGRDLVQKPVEEIAMPLGGTVLDRLAHGLIVALGPAATRMRKRRGRRPLEAGAKPPTAFSCSSGSWSG